MHDYLLSTEWVRFAFVLGIAVSMLLYERRHLTTGSIVVPGYIAVFLAHPLVIVATFANALFTYWFVNHVLRRKFLLYGRTKFTVLALISTLIQSLMLHFSPTGQWLWERDIALFVGAGYIVPGLIAHDMARQGVAKTTKSVLLAGVIVALPIALAIGFDLPGANDIAPFVGHGRYAFPASWIPIAVIISIAASWAVSHNYGCRSGGFVGAALLSMFMADPWQVVAAMSIAAVSYLIVAKALMPRMILFGRRKFSAMLLVSASITWTAIWIAGTTMSDGTALHFGAGSLALTPLVLPGLIANDIQRTSPKMVAVGLTLAGLCSVTATWWIGAELTGRHLEPGWKLLTVAIVLVLGWPQFVALGTWALGRVTGRAAAARPVLETLADFGAGALAAARQRWAEAVDTVALSTQRLASHLGLAEQPDHQIRLAYAPAEGPQLPVRVGGGLDAWRRWARANPRTAAEAEAWVDRALARSSPHVRTAPDSTPHPNPRPHPVPTPTPTRRFVEFDHVTAVLLRESLTSVNRPTVPLDDEAARAWWQSLATSARVELAAARRQADVAETIDKEFPHTEVSRS